MNKLSPTVPDDEWQQAVDSASLFSHIAAARDYGLINYGGEIDALRCAVILSEGASRGVHPRPIEELLAESLKPA